ncbi:MULTISPECIES: erythromycin esterase family protein [unclassified Streptomyces]|uniref:erythromycin esterase family protein n=1 Tax=unclassified Streptomyces TaxID=2593676 RepID=UPI002DD89643|nr:MULTISPECIES: erythromycin esterase family protein [unclassified Streptomyces]WSF83824.1 erythromycin esterase family protein [Streptomyces sp. NBC_01744]WSC39892.1 erythromycin esterase family protein [Streptomyces sp. NBC_01763]WSC48059.1 erythromycin esterase family protein [Streptomyces sp. NBC_01762]WSC52979.1 erythromycin esterase family protein [Streptomyces sp. NBC_01761]WSD27708.1 erythromycin esterase family protein [Streptomyces sp. NBC_01751]
MATDIEDTAHAVEAAAVMRLLPARPRLLALGEPTHGEDALLDLRNEFFRQLVEQEGYRTIAIESDCMMGLVVDDYVTSGTGTLDEVMEQGISHGWGTSAANRELVRWMRAYNVRADDDGRPASERLHFAGFDGPLEITHAASPRQALTALHGYLADRVDADLLPCTADTLDRLLGADDRWTDPAAMMDPSRSTGQSAEAGQLRLLADDLAALLDAQTPHLITATSRDDWDRARLYGRTALGLLRYHYWMAATSPARMTRLVGVRDQMMAHNLLAVAARGPALIHAHNSHLQREKSTMRMGGMPLEWWSAGALVSTQLGEGYAFVATALGTIRHQGVDTPPPDTVEGLLYALPEDRCVIDAPRLAAALCDTRPAPRVSPWFGYSPLDPAHLADSDGIVFVRDVPQS